MFDLHTWPDPGIVHMKARTAKPYMRPHELPFAAIGQGFLDAEQCAKISGYCSQIKPHKFKGCGGTTREVPWPLDSEVFQPVVEFAFGMNKFYWNYDLDNEPAAFHQTYEAGDDYDLHMDGNIGQMRKLTAVVMLSDPEDYHGGLLQIHHHPAIYAPPISRGTIVVFLHWMLHAVTPVVSGKRETLNMGFWGPNFR